MSARIAPADRKHPGRGGHPPTLIQQVCSLYEVAGWPAAQIAPRLGLTRGQVNGIIWRNGCVRAPTTRADLNFIASLLQPAPEREPAPA
ncbi:MAG: hypothetical protein JWQ97_966 [Phenylobacterium sp.]|nr:hypothetical protein [Phenylobacterium sp.]